MRYRKRWTFACIALACLAAAGCSASGGNASGITNVSYIGVQEQGASGYAATLLDGHFTQERLTFSPTWATTGPVILQGVVGGSFDVGSAGPAQVYEAIKNGACVRVLRPTEGAAYGLIAQPNLHLDNTLPYPRVLEQLKGKTIGVAARGAAQELVIGKLLTDAGLNPESDVTWVAIGAGPTATTAFATHKIDVAVSVSQTEVNLRASGTKFDKLLNLTGSHTPLGTFWQAVAVANCKWADTHHETLLKFCHALNEGYADLAHDPTAGPKAFAYVKVGSNLSESTNLWSKYKAPVLEMPALNLRNWRYQGRFTPTDYAPDYSTYVVRGCANA